MAVARDPVAGSYADMKGFHDRAYSLISEALNIDESGVGETERVIDLYSKGATYLQNGISVVITVDDREYDRCERLREKMANNLDMVTTRVTDLLDGKSLKGASGNRSGTGFPSPTESLEAMSKQRPAKRKSAPIVTVHKKQPHSQPRTTYRTASHVPQAASSTKSKQQQPLEVKGVDPALVQTITSEIQEVAPNVTFKDVVGLESAKKALQEIVVYPALNPQLFVGLRAPAKGLLLFGPPGNGKTMLAKAVARESNATFFNISSSSLTSKWVGEGEKLVRALFAVARQKQPAIVFIDEVDALLSKRGQGEHDAMRRLKNEFLLQFDGMGSSDSDRLLVMGATNRPDEIDDAALRRFTKRIYIPLPSVEAREGVLNALLKKHKHSLSPQQITELGMITDGYSGCDLTSLAKDAALGPIRELNMASLKKATQDEVRPISFEDFKSSLKQIKPSIAHDAVAGMEEWNRQYGVSS